MNFIKKDWTGIWTVGIAFKREHIVLFLGRYAFALKWR